MQEKIPRHEPRLFARHFANHLVSFYLFHYYFLVGSIKCYQCSSMTNPGCNTNPAEDLVIECQNLNEQSSDLIRQTLREGIDSLNFLGQFCKACSNQYITQLGSKSKFSAVVRILFFCRRPIAKVVFSASPGNKIVYASRG